MFRFPGFSESEGSVTRARMGGGSYERVPSKGVGIAVMRLQPLHLGHLALINAMQEETDRCIIVIGSGQESRTPSNPFTLRERVDMLQQVWVCYKPHYIYVVPDIGAATDQQWCEFVLKTLELKPASIQDHEDYTTYYCGTEEDGNAWTKSGYKIRMRNLKRDAMGTSGTNGMCPNQYNVFVNTSHSGERRFSSLSI